MSRPPIIAGRHRHVRDVAALIAAAFHPLPAAEWLVPDPIARLRAMHGQFAILVEHAVTVGQVWLTADGHAAAVWFPRDRHLPPPTDYDRRLAAATGEHVHQFRALDALLDERHPKDPHWHLAFLAVHPDRQGHGLGSALLQHTHDWLDAGGVDAYLEASSMRSRDLYTRHGYQAMLPFRPADTGPLFYPMWRHGHRPPGDPGS